MSNDINNSNNYTSLQFHHSISHSPFRPTLLSFPSFRSLASLTNKCTHNFGRTNIRNFIPKNNYAIYKYIINYN